MSLMRLLGFFDYGRHWLVKKRQESLIEVYRASDVHPGMLLLGCAYREAVAQWLMPGPTRRPSRGEGCPIGPL
ncbi:hypothetical protein BHE74_00041940 [Ensete ventricosum]|nr:hypothetical protein BHE74_00041940 [Ensete ventricosum]